MLKLTRQVNVLIYFIVELILFYYLYDVICFLVWFTLDLSLNPIDNLEVVLVEEPEEVSNSSRIESYPTEQKVSDELKMNILKYSLPKFSAVETTSEDDLENISESSQLLV